jgi:peptidoglycan/LPS O-acetylase OafA/YrhL
MRDPRGPASLDETASSEVSPRQQSKEKVDLPRASSSGNTKAESTNDRVFYPALDGLRAVAFLMVFFQHYCSLPWGWAGVNVFFVLSGFLITGILFDSRDDSRKAKTFYIRRALRIFPLYYAVLLATLFFNPLLHWRWSIYWFAWPLYLANFLPFLSQSVLVDGGPLQLAAWAWLRPAVVPGFIFYLGHFWSLCVEEQFYFVWPWIVFWTRNRRVLIWMCGLVVIIVPLLRVLAQHIAPAWMLRVDLLDRATPFQLDSLLLGGLVALLLRGRHGEQLLISGKIVALLAAIAGGVVIAVGIAQSYPNWRDGYPYPSWKYTWGLTFIDVFAAGIIITALRPSSFLYVVLSLRPLRWIGRISYGAYVIHGIFGRIYWAAVTAAGIRFQFVANHFTVFYCLLGLTCTLVLSWLSFEFFEKRFLNLKERWTAPPQQAAVQTGAR